MQEPSAWRGAQAWRRAVVALLLGGLLFALLVPPREEQSLLQHEKSLLFPKKEYSSLPPPSPPSVMASLQWPFPTPMEFITSLVSFFFVSVLLCFTVTLLRGRPKLALVSDSGPPPRSKGISPREEEAYVTVPATPTTAAAAAAAPPSAPPPPTPPRPPPTPPRPPTPPQPTPREALPPIARPASPSERSSHGYTTGGSTGSSGQPSERERTLSSGSQASQRVFMPLLVTKSEPAEPPATPRKYEA